ncbi:MAG: chromosomal replication initiator DnaA [Rhizobiales bacterium]|jgi:hypothetical protein|nr:chromosomal replication initiator DnaA [Hyphomicrobiales bacterium]
MNERLHDGESGGMDGWRRCPPDLRERTASLIEGLVASAFGIAGKELAAPGRGKAGVSVARQAAMYLAHTQLRVSLTLAGGFFGRDRTTAAHACRRVEERRDDPRFDAVMACLERAVAVWPELARLTQVAE